MTTEAEWDEVNEKFGYDLKAAFQYNGGQPIQPEDIESIDKEWTDGADEASFVWLLKLKDGRWAAASGSHDYTGWDCQSSLSVLVFPARDECIRHGLTLNERENLGLLLPDDGPAVLP